MSSPIKVSDGQAGRASLRSPVSPNKKLDIALGLFLGLAVGLGIAVLRDTLDTSVKTMSDLAAGDARRRFSAASCSTRGTEAAADHPRRSAVAPR